MRSSSNVPILFYVPILLQTANVSLSFASTSKIGLPKLIKFSFSSSTLILLQLVHCEKINDHLHLYLFAEHICFVWWQFLIIAIFLPTFAMFPLSFGMALDRLKKRKISVDIFMLSCVFPFIFYAKQKDQEDTDILDEDDERCRIMILEQEEELFDVDDKSLRWPVVQLYRMLVIVLVNTFVLNSIFKCLWFASIFGAFLVHDAYRNPFKSKFLNGMQSLTSACLFLVTLCSVPSGISSVVDIRGIPNMDICLVVLRYCERSLYMVVLLSFPVWKLREKYNERAERRRK